MRTLSVFFLAASTMACAAMSVQACSSDPGAPNLDGDLDATVPDATVEAPDADRADTAPPVKEAGPRTPKPTDGGIDLDNLGPDEHALQINECPAFAACGGTLGETDFDYTGGCFDEDALEDVIAGQAGCPVEVSNSRAVVKGEFDFAPNTQYERDLTLRVSADVLIPASCQLLLSFGTCATLGPNAAAFGITGLRCYELAEGPGCDCILETSTVQEAMGAYTLIDEGKVLSMQGPDGGTVTAPYCVAGDGTMTHTDRASTANPADPGNFITWKLTPEPQ